MPGDFTEEDMAGFTVGGIAASNITTSTEEGLAITASMGRLATTATRFTHNPSYGYPYYGSPAYPYPSYGPCYAVDAYGRCVSYVPNGGYSPY